MLRKVHFHGSISHPTIEIYGDTIYDVIDGASRQVPTIQNRKLIEIAGCETEADLHRYLGDQVDIHVYPALIGAKSKITQIIVGATLVALSFFMPVAAPGALFSLQGFTFQLGAMLIVGGIAALLAPQPELGDDDKRSDIFSGSRNTVKIGTPIPILYGEFRCGGHYLSFDVNSSKKLSKA